MIRILKNSVFTDERYTLLLDDLDRTKNDLACAYANLENVVDPDLIDSCIYELKAAQMRYKFLLSRVKQIEDSQAKNPLEFSGS